MYANDAMFQNSNQPNILKSLKVSIYLKMEQKHIPEYKTTLIHNVFMLRSKLKF